MHAQIDGTPVTGWLPNKNPTSLASLHHRRALTNEERIRVSNVTVPFSLHHRRHTEPETFETLTDGRVVFRDSSENVVSCFRSDPSAVEGQQKLSEWVTTDNVMVQKLPAGELTFESPAPTQPGPTDFEFQGGFVRVGSAFHRVDRVGAPDGGNTVEQTQDGRMVVGGVFFSNPPLDFAVVDGTRFPIVWRDNPGVNYEPGDAYEHRHLPDGEVFVPQLNNHFRLATAPRIRLHEPLSFVTLPSDGSVATIDVDEMYVPAVITMNMVVAAVLCVASIVCCSCHTDALYNLGLDGRRRSGVVVGSCLCCMSLAFFSLSFRPAKRLIYS